MSAEQPPRINRRVFLGGAFAAGLGIAVFEKSKQAAESYDIPPVQFPVLESSPTPPLEATPIDS